MSRGEQIGTVCYRHPDRVAGATCRRCHRPICPECMREAPVGWHCAACVHDDNRSAPVTRWRPRPTAALGQSRLTPVVAALIGLNAVIYLATASRQVNIDFRFGMIPAEVASGQWYRLLTAAFLHASLSHIFFNMFTLAVIGPAVESSLGRVRFTAMYVLAALGGSVASYLLGPFNTEALGASGAIFGVMGAYLVLARRSGTDTRTVLALIGINLLIGFIEPGIDWRAHIGGLAIGVVVAFGFSRAADLRRGTGGIAAAAIVAATASVIAVAAQLPAGHVNL